MQRYRPELDDFDVETDDSSEDGGSDGGGDLQPVAFAGVVDMINLRGGSGKG